MIKWFPKQLLRLGEEGQRHRIHHRILSVLKERVGCSVQDTRAATFHSNIMALFVEFNLKSSITSLVTLLFNLQNKIF